MSSIMRRRNGLMASSVMGMLLSDVRLATPHLQTGCSHPDTRPIRKPKATWVEPKFFADVEYRDITSEGLLRASSFKGLTKGTGRI